MSVQTGIEWTDSTWNPIRGCSLVSEGCRNCYAMGVAARFSEPGQAYYGLARRRSNGEPQWTGEVAVVDRHMLDPLKWRGPRRIFVNSMSDLFHEKVPFETIAQVFAVMSLAPRHTFQVLTKRPARMRAFFDWVVKEGVELAEEAPEPWDGANVVTHHAIIGDVGSAPAFQRAYDAVSNNEPPEWPLPNVWLGVSVEHQAAADERIPLLLRTPAAVRFLSCEPLLGPLSVQRWLMSSDGFAANDLKGPIHRDDGGVGIDWVIVGGESGRHARPMHPDWAIHLASECEELGVPFFFKQWGEYSPVTPVYRERDERALDEADNNLVTVVDLHGREWINNEQRCDGQPPPGSWFVERVGKKRAGRELLGRTWDAFPEVRS